MDRNFKDHNNLTWKYRYALCNSCNLNNNENNFHLNVVIHNLKGYDSHLLISELNKFVDY